MNKLPDKPSELIRLAIKDLETVEQNSQYEINMVFWHEPVIQDGIRKKCLVCLAGSVMANTLNTNPDELHNPGEYDIDTENKLDGLNSLRTGDIGAFMYELGYGYTDEDFTIIDNCINIYHKYKDLINIRYNTFSNERNEFSDYKYPKEFKKCMLEIADTLEKADY